MRHKILFVLIWVVILILGWILWKAHPRFEKDPRGYTESHMRHIAFAMNAYHDDTGLWPDINAWKEQLEKHFPDFKKAFFLNQTGFNDWWKNGIKYEVVHSGEKTWRLLRSYGANKKDDKGMADDITIEVEGMEDMSKLPILQSLFGAIKEPNSK